MASKDVAEHYNNVRQEGLGVRSQSRIYYQRNLNNWLKSELINKAVSLLSSDKVRVLDIGCGKGGDLRKWQFKACSMVLADVADVSIEQARSRYEENKLKRQTDIPIQFIVADCCKVDLAPLIEDKTSFDIVSCQFSLHYSFINEESARCFLKNCTQNLKPGGLFIGTLPDAERIVWAARENDGEYKTAVCSVTFENKEEMKGQPPLFGSMFHFSLDSQVNCPEFLAYFPLLQQLLSEMDMELVFMYRFPEAIEQWREQGRGLMGRMSALEAFPPSEGVKLAGKEEEYESATKFLADLTSEKRSVGTLSQSEWETVCMYLAFAFRKKGGERMEDSPLKRKTNEDTHLAHAESDTPSEKKTKLDEETEADE
ncbi:unnamed protein product [Auanema sp. JU1783]|nr:unnamed protein product [Auanema sp. JU1783]